MYMLHPKATIIFLIILNVSGICHAEEHSMHVRVAYKEITDPQNPGFYYQSVLKLALEKTRATHGDYQLSFLDEIVTVDRMINMVVSGNHADLIWASVTPKRKETMRVVPINLLRNFNNFRLLLVLSKNEDIFKNVKTLAELAQFKAGNGLNWTDTKIFEANGIPVTTSVQYNYLIYMLQANRFDYISRGLHEIDNDIKMFYREDLAIAKGIVLKYKHPVSYSFFVTQTNTLLAERLEAGLILAEEDGSFQEAYENIASYKSGIEELNKTRQVIELDNSLTIQHPK